MTTNSLRPLHLENSLDPRLEFMEYAQRQAKWAIFKGAENNNYVQQQANSYGTSGVVWSFNTQSDQVGIDRRLYAEVQFKISFTGTSAIGAPLLQDGHDAPRAFPLASVTNSLKVTLNGTSVEAQYADALQAMLRFNTSFEQEAYDLSGTPNYLDNCQDYNALSTGTMNPLATYNSSTTQKLGRGAFRLDSVVNPVSTDGVTPTTSVVTFTVIEPLLISPMLYRSDDLEASLVGIKNMAVQFNFIAGQLDRVWSHDASSSGVTITSVNVEIGPNAGTAPPKLHILYLTPPLIDAGRIPDMINYEYNKTDVFVNDMNTTMNAGATQSFVNNAIQLSTVPKCVYIYACLPNNQKDYEATDSFFAINSISLQYLNTSGQLSSATSFDLYQMSVKNGSKQTWEEWQGRTQSIGLSTASISYVPLCGGVLKIDAEDLALPSNVATGQNVNSQFQYTINITNTSASSKAVQLVTVFVYEGLLTVDMTNAVVTTQVGVIDTRDVIETRARGAWVPYSKQMDLTGGSWKGFKRFLGKVFHFAKKAAPYVKGAIDVAKVAGLGMDMEEEDDYAGQGYAGAIAGAVAGARPKHKLNMRRKCGSGLELGGRVLSREEMRRMLME